MVQRSRVYYCGRREKAWDRGYDYAHLSVRAVQKPGKAMSKAFGSTIVDGPEVYEDRDPAQREAEGPIASMDYSEFTLLDFLSTKKYLIDRARIRAIRESSCTSVTRTCQRTPPKVCCWNSASPHTLRSCFGSLSLKLARDRAHALRAMPGRLFLF